jgi:hypothetical protein
VSPDRLVANFHGSLPSFPYRVLRRPDNLGFQGDIMKFRFEPVLQIVLNGVTALDASLRRDPDSIFSEKRGYSRSILSIECCGKFSLELV